MKKFTLVIMVMFALGTFAQSTHTIDFESAGVGGDWNWIVGENDDNPALEFVANPLTSGINTSATVAKFTARVTGQPWALCFTDDDGEFTFNASNAIVKIMVYKPVISDVGIKFEGAGSPVEIEIPNTVTNQWEELTFDFSGSIGNTFSRLIIIPDFATRTQENLIYFDNIQVPDGIPAGPLPEPTSAAPTPTQNPANVISMFSDAFTDVPVDTWLTSWSVGNLEDVLIAGNPTKKYTQVSFVGIETVGPNMLDVSNMTNFHIDIWTPDANDFKVKLVDFGNDGAYGGGDDTEHEITFASPATETWISYNIPLSDFTNLNITGHLAQYILSKGPLGTLYVDNVYFYSSGANFMTFDPANGANSVPVEVNPTLTFSAPVVKANGNPVANSDIPSIITFKETNTSGANVPFTGNIDAAKQVITVIPNTNLDNNQIYYLALNNNVIKYQSGELIAGVSITFTTISQVTMVLYDNFDNPSGITWGYWDNQAGGILDVEASNPALFSSVNTTPIVAKLTKEAGSDPYTHTLAILRGQLDLSTNNQFQMMVYSESAGTDFALKLQNNDLAEPWTTEVTVEHTIQNANTWQIIIYDFSAYSDRTDLDKLLLMINPGQTGAGVFYFDQIYGPPFTPPAASPVVVDAYTAAEGSAIEVKFDKDMEPEPGNNGNFNLYADGVLYPVASTLRKPEDPSIIVLNLTTPVQPGDELLLAYLMSGTVTSLDNGVLQPFQDYPVTNTLMTNLGITVLLEGPFNSLNMFATLNPTYLPLSQPYNATPWNYNGSESVASIPNSNVVDWLLIEVRDASNAALATGETMVARQAAFLLNDGSVVGLDGSSDLTFDVNIVDSLFVVVWHRNHLRVLSSHGLVRENNLYSYNFDSGENQAYGGNLKEIEPGIWGMISGNGNGDNQIDDLDKTDVWEIESGNSGYLQGDFNLDGKVNNIDKNDYWRKNIGSFAEEYQLIWQDEFDGDGLPAPDK